MFNFKTTPHSWRGEICVRVFFFFLSMGFLYTISYVQVILLIKQNISFTWISNRTNLRNQQRRHRASAIHLPRTRVHVAFRPHCNELHVAPFCTVTNNFSNTTYALVLCVLYLYCEFLFYNVRPCRICIEHRILHVRVSQNALHTTFTANEMEWGKYIYNIITNLDTQIYSHR